MMAGVIWHTFIIIIMVLFYLFIQYYAVLKEIGIPLVIWLIFSDIAYL